MRRPIVAIVAAALAAGAGAAATQAGTRTSRSAVSGPHCARQFPRMMRDGFPEPPMRVSRNGRLDTTLRAGIGPVTIAGKRYVTMNYDGSFPGPTLVFCPGDKVTVHLVNALGEDTNLHVHGMHVSPTANHDNVYLDIHSGQRFTYEYSIPTDQDPGANWYHPHRHMLVEPQVFAGLAGAMVVEGGLDNLLPNVPQRLMVIQSTELCNATGHTVAFPGSGTEKCAQPGHTVPVDKTVEAHTPLLINGALNPTVKIRPGQIQRWRIYNANDNRIVMLNLRGQNLQLLAEDGNTLQWMRATRNLLIGPGSRREVLVRGGPPGRYPMKALPFSQFPGGVVAANGGPTPNQTVLTVVSSGPRAADHFPRGALSHPLDLRRRRVDRHRQIVFSETEVSKGNFDFKLNGHVFDPNFIAVTMKLGSTEEWTLVNTNTEWHTFHIHQNPFQVISVNGRRLRAIQYEDNVAMPPKSRIVIRMHPTDFTGKFVFHCHVTFHEDHGMMAAIQVVRNPAPAQLRASAVAVHGITIRSAAYGASAALPAPVSFFCRLLGVPIGPSGTRSVTAGVPARRDPTSSALARHP